MLNTLKKDLLVGRFNKNQQKKDTYVEIFIFFLRPIVNKSKQK